jgi:iron(III) transport system ATP-binding protein
MTETFVTASISVKNLSKHFGSVKAVDNIELNVEAGTLVCLLGPSGCGKTTTLRMIGGFEEPTTGSIYLEDEDVTAMPPYARPTAMVFQSYALFPHMSIFDNIAYGLRARRMSRSEIKEKVQDAVALMELEGQEKKSPPQLSGGQQQRVALARALVIRPKVLLFDEPLSNLDALLRVRMRSELRSIQKRLGITSLYVTHDQEEAFSIADKVAIMNKGKLVQLGSPLDLYREPADRFVADFVGQSNILPVEVVESNARGTTVRFLEETIHSRRPLKNPGAEVSIVLRPEALEIEEASGSGVPAHVRTIAFTGPIVRYTVVTEGDMELMIDLPNPRPDQFFDEGTKVTVQIPKEVPALLEG